MVRKPAIVTMAKFTEEYPMSRKTVVTGSALKKYLFAAAGGLALLASIHWNEYVRGNPYVLVPFLLALLCLIGNSQDGALRPVVRRNLERGALVLFALSGLNFLITALGA